jgi:hypothetical protein
MIAADALALVLKHWKAITGGLIVAALLSYALIQRHNAHSWQEKAATAQAQAQMANDKLAVSNASIASLMGQLDVKNAETEARAKAYEAAKAQDAATIAALDKQYSATKTRKDALEAYAKTAAANPTCRVPPALVKLTEGL